MLPKIKKRLKSFVLEEEGRISKQAVLKIGTALALSSISLSQVFGGCSCGSSDPCAGGGGGGGGGSCGCEEAGGGAYCLLNDSLILMPDNNLMKVQDLIEGDSVSSINIESGLIESTEVTKIIKEHIRNSYYVINEALFITSDHPVLVLRNSKLDWIKVENLRIDDLIKSLYGFTKIERIVRIQEPAYTVYVETKSGSLIVKGGFSYYVVKSKYIPFEFEKIDILKNKLPLVYN